MILCIKMCYSAILCITKYLFYIPSPYAFPLVQCGNHSQFCTYQCISWYVCVVASFVQYTSAYQCILVHILLCLCCIEFCTPHHTFVILQSDLQSIRTNFQSFHFVTMTLVIKCKAYQKTYLEKRNRAALHPGQDFFFLPVLGSCEETIHPGHTCLHCHAMRMALCGRHSHFSANSSFWCRG